MKDRKNKGKTVANAALAGIASDVVDRFGSAVKEHEVAYSGVDNEAGQILQKGLKKISDYNRGDPSNPNYKRITKAQAGFSAEVKEVARRRAEEAITGQKPRTLRTDDVPGHVNDQLFDITSTVDSNGNPVPHSSAQMKFVGSSPEAATEKLLSKDFNKYIEGTDHSLGIVASGIGINYLEECFNGQCPYPILKIGHYPLPKKLLRKMTDECDSVLVIEEGQPFIEDILNGVMRGTAIIKGKLTGDLSRTGELTPDMVRCALGLPKTDIIAKSENVVPRPPALCQGCGHRDVYAALNDVLSEYPNARVFGDIGCYTLGALPPYKALDSTVDMGASITMAKGAADAGQWPAVAVIGDSTFTHSGITGLLDAINENSDITVIISDNLTTAMTGGQDSAGTNKLEAICRGLGLAGEHLRTVVPLPKNMPEIERILREEISYHGLSVIIPCRECMQTLKRHLKQKKQNGGTVK